MTLTADIQLVLPDYARSDLAWHETIYTHDVEAFEGYTYTVTGGYIDIALSLYFLLGYNGANSDTRTFGLSTKNADGNTVSLMTASSLVYRAGMPPQYYTFFLGQANVFYDGSQINLCPMILQPLYPGYTLTMLETQDDDLGDSLTFITFSVLHVPTGPALSSNATAPIAI